MNATNHTNIASMNGSLQNGFTGSLVRLAAFDLEHDPEIMARWNQDSEYQQLLSSGPAGLWTPKQIKEWMEKEWNSGYEFAIHTLSDDRFIGTVGIDGIDWAAGNCWVGIGIGERDYWGKGYGSDAMDLILRFAFASLNLKRMSLDVFEYNRRAYLSYCKCGFKEEGRLRQWMKRGGERFDLIYMGILREEWEARQTTAQLEKETDSSMPSAQNGSPGFAGQSTTDN
jgi:RimJ/RimL family protein N-acetyltransferase